MAYGQGIARFFGKKVKAKGSVIVILALISIIGFIFSAFDVWLQWGLGIYSAIIAQFLLGYALYLESNPKSLWNPFKGITINDRFGKLAVYMIALVVMFTAITRLPFLAFTGLADIETVKSLTFFSNIFGAVAIAYEVFVVK